MSGASRQGPADGIPQSALHWERRYAAEGRLWGDEPSELARLAVARLRPCGPADLSVFDVGCGYGRDTRYLATELGCRVVGLDPSPAAISAARSARSPGLDVEYVLGDLVSVVGDGRPAAEGASPASPTQAQAAGPASPAGPYDVAFVGAVYHLLGPIGRRQFAAALGAAVRPGGLLFLSALSPRDAQHYAVGRPVAGEERSWVDHVYLHFFTADELAADLTAFEILDLEERSYVERNRNGALHHHAAWFLEGRRR